MIKLVQLKRCYIRQNFCSWH